MLALPGPNLANQSAKVVPKPKSVPQDNVELGKVSVRKKLNRRLIVILYVPVSLIIFVI